MTYLLIFLGGGFGSLCRYMVAAMVARQMGTGFPYGTLAVNVLGALVMGVLIEYLALKFSVSSNIRLLLTTGFLGGFTTFSAFSLEATQMWLRGDQLFCVTYALISVIGTMLAVWLGMHLVRLLLV